MDRYIKKADKRRKVPATPSENDECNGAPWHRPEGAFPRPGSDSDSATNDASHTWIPLVLPYSPLITRPPFALTTICHHYVSCRCIVAFPSPRISRFLVPSFPFSLTCFVPSTGILPSLPFFLSFLALEILTFSHPFSLFSYHFLLKSSSSPFSLSPLILPFPRGYASEVGGS